LRWRKSRRGSKRRYSYLLRPGSRSEVDVFVLRHRSVFRVKIFVLRRGWSGSEVKVFKRAVILVYQEAVTLWP
jgi:hypothetical protein